jgi:hypothetical protein
LTIVLKNLLARGIPADNLYTGQSCSPITKNPRSMDPCDPFTPTSSPGPSFSVGFLVIICDFALFGQMVLCLSARARTVTVLSLLGQLFALASRETVLKNSFSWGFFARIILSPGVMRQQKKQKKHCNDCILLIRRSDLGEENGELAMHVILIFRTAIHLQYIYCQQE